MDLELDGEYIPQYNNEIWLVVSMLRKHGIPHKVFTFGEFKKSQCCIVTLRYRHTNVIVGQMLIAYDYGTYNTEILSCSSDMHPRMFKNYNNSPFKDANWKSSGARWCTLDGLTRHLLDIMDGRD